MTRAKPILATVAVAFLALQATTPLSAETRPTGFTYYASCSPYGKAHSAPTHICQQGDQIWATLRYGGTPEEYSVCIRRGEGPPSCSPSQLTAPGSSAVTKIRSQNYVGLVTVSWHAGSEEIGSHTIRFLEDPVVPPFGVSALIVSGTQRLFGLIIRNISPGLRVRAWRLCNRPSWCPLPLSIVATEGETRRYRIVASKRNSTFSFGDELWIIANAPGRPKGSKLWDRIYRGVLARDRSGGPNDTAIRRIDPPLCSPPGLGTAFARKCSTARSPKAPPVPPEGPG